MYVVYMPKYKGDIPDFNIIKVISKYMECTNYDCEILSAPGYMNINKFTTDKFYDEIAPIFRREKLDSFQNAEVGIFNGMNGTRRVSSGVTCRQLHENSIVSHRLKLISLQCNKNQDHRKMLFFMEKEASFNDVITIKNYKEFLHTVEVRAIMVGSSNQNFTTYYGGNKQKADKGEADVFMFIGEEKIAKDIIEVGNADIVISKSMNYEKDDAAEGYLRNILEDFLKNSLI